MAPVVRLFAVAVITGEEESGLGAQALHHSAQEPINPGHYLLHSETTVACQIREEGLIHGEAVFRGEASQVLARLPG